MSDEIGPDLAETARQQASDKLSEKETEDLRGQLRKELLKKFEKDTERAERLEMERNPSIIKMIRLSLSKK